MSQFLLKSQSPQFGAYGKIPSAGDFVRLGLSRDFVRAWDAWLQKWLIESSRVLKEDYDAAYMSAPIWRFSLAAGVAGSHPMIGVVMPSVDRVGRRFPLTIAAAPSTGAGNALSMHRAARAVFDPLETLALGTLEPGATRQSLQAGLAALPEATAVSLPVTAPEGGCTCLAGTAPVEAVFSALCGGEEYQVRSAGLPGPREMPALMSLEVPAWDEARVA